MIFYSYFLIFLLSKMFMFINSSDCNYKEEIALHTSRHNEQSDIISVLLKTLHIHQSIKKYTIIQENIKWKLIEMKMNI